jgi:hypothetical protein
VITASPSVTPLPSGSAGPLAIISDVVVVGENAAYAPDGEWFAFTARPADGSTGPDVYVWRNGEERAQAVTTDHRSFFSAWLGDRLVISSAAAFRSSPGQPELIPSSYLVDPATGHRTEMVDTNLWRPVADPEQRWTVGWDGTIRATADGSSIEPAAGRLVLRPWGGRLVEGGAPLPTTATKVLAMGDIHDWDARWDESGHHLALWIADADTPGIGRLTLYETDPVTGTIDDDHPLLRDEPARSGFAIGRGRLAWATPAGENGEGSRVEVLAWKAGSAGQANSQPGSGEVLVTR